MTDRKFLVYSCTFSQTGCPAKLLFIRSENFLGTNFFTFDSQNSIIKHCFHPNDVHFVQCHRKCISSEVCQEIVHQTKLGVPPGRIRSNLDIQCGSNVFYDIRRTAIEEERNEDLDTLIDSLKKGTEKRVICNKDNGILVSLTIIDNRILESEYSDDIAIIDDTAMTNMYGLPLETVVVIDSEKHTQLLGYSIIPNRSTAAFELFCKDYKQFGGKTFRIIVVDRFEAQFDALADAFPETYKMFCLVHFRRDLSSYFASNDSLAIC